MSKKIVSFACVAALSCSAVAHAATIDLHWDASPWNPGPPAGPYSYSVTTEGHTYTGNVSPDRYHGTITAASGVDPTALGDGTGIPEGLFTYCYELTQYFHPGQTVTYTIVPGSTGVTAATLDFLGAVNSLIPGFGASGWLHPSSPNVAAAIQLGIWETLYDSGSPFDITSGNFFTGSALGSASGSVGYYLTQFAGAMGSTQDLGSQYVVRLWNTSDPNQNGAGAQDQITGVLVPRGLTVPEPGTLLLIGTAFLAAPLSRRKRAG